MKKITFAILLFLLIAGSFSSDVHAQGQVTIPSGATVPTNCTPSSGGTRLFYKRSGANVGLHECTAANTWTYRGSLNFGGTLTPTALSGDVNNYSPTNLASSFAIRISGGASDRNITGLATGSDGRLVLLINIGTTNNLTLVDQSASSTAANRFLIGADVVLGPNQAALLRYDGTSSRWRPTSQVLTSTGVTAGSYGPMTATVDAAGRVTNASTSTANAIVAPLVCTDAGASDAYTCTPTPAATSYTNLTVVFTPNTVNTGAATLNISGLGVKNIKKLVGGAVSDPASNDLRAGGRYLLSYDGTQMLIVSLLGNAPLTSALADPGGNGIVVRTALDTTTNRSVAAGSAAVTVTNGDGVAGNPTINLPYTVYVATVTQTGTDAPVATVHTNTTGATLTFARSVAGVYTITADSAIFAANKTGVLYSQVNNATGDRVYVVSHLRTSTTVITVNTKFQDGPAGGGQPTDDVLAETLFEIRIYP